MTATRVWHAQWAWLGGETAVADVRIEVEGARITGLTPATAPTAEAEPLRGLVLPGLRNAHSHVFHRALRGRTHGGEGDFWTWRDAMYALALRLTPDSLFGLARATYGEMLQAGITHVEEFHYLHHPAGMDDAVVAAAAEAGIGLTLVDACYLRAGFGEGHLAPAQERFSDGSVDAWAERADGLAARHPHLALAAAVHSVRAVAPQDIQAVGAAARARGRAIHVHLSEQAAENEACRAATGRTPTEVLAEAGVLADTTTVVHATHLTDRDVAALGTARVRACICPTTERDLADGVGPVPALHVAGCRLALGSDSQAVIDLFEEARALEHHERLASGRRGRFPPVALLAAATGRPGLALGQPADFIAVAADTVRTAGFDPAHAAATAVFSATAADVTDVVVGARSVIRSGRHETIDVAPALAAAVAEVGP